MQCPDCEADLKTEKVGLVEIERCGGCGGTWFDEGELGKVRATMHPPEAEQTFTPTHVPAGPCPRCQHTVLVGGFVAPTPVGRCPRCRGIWVSKPIGAAKDRTATLEAVMWLLEIVFGVIEILV
jgi:Zn-finger nucleic acid-binding protein